MKKILIISIIILLLSSLGCKEETQEKEIIKESTYNLIEYDNYVYEGNAPVYVTIYSHNEDSWKSVVNTKEKYVSYRTDLIERAEVLAENNIPWNWQSDQPVIEAMIEYEDDEELLERTNEMNILLYLESLGAQLDPHAHTNNYADIAYLMEEQGATPSSVIGGLIMEECGSEHLEFLNYVNWYNEIDLQSDGYIYGSDYPNAKWKPTILSDPGMGGHWFDDWTTGVWKPGKEDDFYTHFPASDIVYIGEGYPHDALNIGEAHSSGAVVHAENAEYIRELVAKIKNKEVPTGTTDGKKFMYTASVHFRDKGIVRESNTPIITKEAMQEFLDILNPYEIAGDIIYVNFETAAEIWSTEYNEVPWQLSLESFSFYEEVKEQAEDYCKTDKPIKR